MTIFDKSQMSKSIFCEGFPEKSFIINNHNTHVIKNDVIHQLVEVSGKTPKGVFSWKCASNLHWKQKNAEQCINTRLQPIKLFFFLTAGFSCLPDTSPGGLADSHMISWLHHSSVHAHIKTLLVWLEALDTSMTNTWKRRWKWHYRSRFMAVDYQLHWLQGWDFKLWISCQLCWFRTFPKCEHFYPSKLKKDAIKGKLVKLKISPFVFRQWHLFNHFKQ